MVDAIDVSDLIRKIVADGTYVGEFESKIRTQLLLNRKIVVLRVPRSQVRNDVIAGQKAPNRVSDRIRNGRGRNARGACRNLNRRRAWNALVKLVIPEIGRESGRRRALTGGLRVACDRGIAVTRTVVHRAGSSGVERLLDRKWKVLGKNIFSPIVFRRVEKAVAGAKHEFSIDLKSRAEAWCKIRHSRIDQARRVRAASGKRKAVALGIVIRLIVIG